MKVEFMAKQDGKKFYYEVKEQEDGFVLIRKLRPKNYLKIASKTKLDSITECVTEIITDFI